MTALALMEIHSTVSIIACLLLLCHCCHNHTSMSICLAQLHPMVRVRQACVVACFNKCLGEGSAHKVGTFYSRVTAVHVHMTMLQLQR